MAPLAHPCCKRAGGFDLCGLPKLGCSVLRDLLVPSLFASRDARPALGGREEARAGERAIERFPRARGSGRRVLRHLGYSRACGAARHPGGWGESVVVTGDRGWQQPVGGDGREVAEETVEAGGGKVGGGRDWTLGRKDF